MDLTIVKLEVNRERLLGAVTPEIFATDRALELVARGMPFRDAYREVGGSLEKLAGSDPVEAIKKKTSSGATGNLRLDVAKNGAAALLKKVDAEESASREKISSLAGRDVELFVDPLAQR
jgi:argininosuccinate lyase